jgi:MerR family transcriptional regulator/heat shock protein HspR
MPEQQDYSLSFYTEPEIAEYSRLEVQVIRQLAKDEVINTLELAGQERQYDRANLALLRRARRLYQDLGVNLEGVEIIMQLISRIERLQQELALHREAGERPAETENPGAS